MKRIRVLGVFLVAAGAVMAVWMAQPLRRAEPPRVNGSGLDPAIAQLLRTASQEVRDQRGSAAAWGKLGAVFWHADFVDEARRALAEAERLGPTDPRWPYWQGLLLLSRDADQALAKFRRAVELCPGQPDAPRLRLAEFLAERGRTTEAEAQFDRLLTQTPGHPLALLGKARLRWAAGRFQEGTNVLRGCLTDPRTAKSAHALHALLLRALGDTRGAGAAARRSAGLPQDAPWPDSFWDEARLYRVSRKAWLEEAAALMDHNQDEAALNLLARVAQAYPEDEESWYLAGWARNRLQQPAEAEAALRQHLRRAPKSAKGLAQLAVALLAQQRYPEAVTVLSEALQLKPGWRELHSNLAYAQVQLGRPEAAVREYAEALAADPNYLPSYLALAELALRRGDHDEARRQLLGARALDPENAQVQTLWQRMETVR